MEPLVPSPQLCVGSEITASSPSSFTSFPSSFSPVAWSQDPCSEDALPDNTSHDGTQDPLEMGIFSFDLTFLKRGIQKGERAGEALALTDLLSS